MHTDIYNPILFEKKKLLTEITATLLHILFDMTNTLLSEVCFTGSF